MEVRCKVMKNAIITMNGHHNYGNRLQNFALQYFLGSFGNSETIWWSENNYLPSTGNNYSLKSIIKYILNYRNQRDDVSKFYTRIGIREYNIKKFSDDHIVIKYDYCIKKNLNFQYDNFIVGSDQVWNPLFWDNEVSKEVNFLQFTDLKKRIAYAASFGIRELPSKFIDIFKEGLDGIPFISVREQAGAAIVKRLTGREVPVLVDPTLLLDADEWRALVMRPKWYKGEKYILTYFLGNVPSMIDTLAKKRDYKIYNMMDKNCLELYVSRVEEFLYLIDNAELVCTDSFHACVFSILFNTPFIVVNRKQKGMADMTSRLDTLMDLFGYKDRYINFDNDENDCENFFNMEFSEVKRIQEIERQRSYKFLQEALKL